METSTLGANYTTTTEGPVYFESGVARNIWAYGSPVFIAIGTMGNLLSATVMLRQKLRKRTTSLYLFVLAVVDTVVLYTGLMEQWIRKLFGIAILNANIVTCLSFRFVVCLAIDVEAWILVCVAVERMVAVFWPHKANQMFTRAFAVRQIAIIGVILAVPNSHFYWTFTLVNGRCIPKDGYKHLIGTIFPWIDLCLACLIPFLIMLVANSSIAAKLIRANHVRKTKLNVGKDKKLTSMTAILFSITATFLLTTAPVTVFLYVIKYSKQGIAQYELLWTSLSLLFYANYSVNFLLYCASGSRFRREFVRMCRIKINDSRMARQNDYACRRLEAEANTRL